MKFTETHRLEQERLHMDPDYGVSGVQYAPLVSQIINRLKVSQLLDYGCGKARLMKHIKADHAVKIQCYDPAIPGFAGDPIPMQMVTCIDVLEHVEPDCLDAVLDDLQRVTEVIGFFSVSLVEGQDLRWWLDKLLPRFDLQTLQVTPTGFYAIVYARPKPLVETIQ